MRVYDEALAGGGLIGGQVLLAPLDFMVRQQYLHARSTLTRLLELGVVPVVNENDAIADDEIRFGDNDRMAALVAHLISADLLVLLTDQPGLLTADPRSDAEASLIEEIVEVDHTLERMAGGDRQRPGERGHGLQAGGGQDRRLVGRAGGHRPGRPGERAGRGRGRAHRGGHGGRAPEPAAAGPQAVDRLRRRLVRAPSSSTRGPSGRCWSGASRCCRPA